MTPSKLLIEQLLFYVEDIEDNLIIVSASDLEENKEKLQLYLAAKNFLEKYG